MFSAALGLAILVTAPAPRDPKKDPPGLVGRWNLESATFAGMPLPKMETTTTITFTRDGRYETKSGAGDTKVAGTFTFDPKKDPPELEVTDPAGPNAGKVSPAIYRIDGDTLTICTSTDGDRPRTFDAPAGSKFVLLVLKRVKD